MIGIGADHGGYEFKKDIKKYLDELGLEYIDFGTDSPERTDYPIYASKVSEAIQSGQCDKGILLCRSGYGMTIVANKYKGVRCATCYDEETARHAKTNDNVNVIALPGDYIDIRFQLPSGQDYIVLSKKKVLMSSQTGIWLKLSELELLTINNAIVEAWTIKGSKIYAIEYSEAEITTSVKFLL